jgi:hypothetical protein
MRLEKKQLPVAVCRTENSNRKQPGQKIMIDKFRIIICQLFLGRDNDYS